MPKATAEERFWSRVARRGPDECWLWTAGRTKAGYGTFLAPGSNGYAHRFSYRLLVGPIPDGFHIDHICHNEDEFCAGGNTCEHRACVNPAHLEAVPQPVNIARGHGHGSETHCPKGHLYDDVNTYRPERGGRMCRQCMRDYEKRRPKRPYDPEARRQMYLRKLAREGRSPRS